MAARALRALAVPLVTLRGGSFCCSRENPGVSRLMRGLRLRHPVRPVMGASSYSVTRCSNGSSVRYFTARNAKLERMLATPGTRVKCRLRNCS